MTQVRWAIAVGLLLAAGPAAASDDERGAVSVGGGVFAPYDGDVGPAVLLGGEGRVSRHVGVGGELEYRQSEADGVKGSQADVQSLQVRALVRYTWDPGIVRPYMGAGAGFGIHDVDGAIRSDDQFFSVSGTAVSLGLLGLAGIDLPLGDRLSLFAEGRISGDFATTLVSGTQLGGMTGVSGARSRF